MAQMNRLLADPNALDEMQIMQSAGALEDIYG